MARISVWLLVVIAVGAAPARSASDDPRAVAAIQRAAALLKAAQVDAGAAAVDEAERLAGRSPSTAMRARIETARGRVDDLHGRAGPALAHFQAAVKLAEASGDPSILATTLDAAAVASSNASKWGEALAYAERALQVNPHAGAHDRASMMYHRGAALASVSQGADAERVFREAAALAEASHDSALAADVHRAIGQLIWRARRDRPAALVEFDIALREARASANPLPLVNVLNNIGNIYRSNVVREGNNLPEALRLYIEAAAIALRLHLDGPAALVLKNVGDVKRQMGDRAGAEQALLQAMAIGERGDNMVRWQAQLILGLTLRDVDPDRAEKHFSECLDVLEAQQSNVLLEDYRAGALAGLVAISENPYSQYIDFLLAQGHADRAFLVAERAKARAFLDILSQSREQIAAAVPRQFVADENRLLAAISRAQASLRAVDVDAATRRDTAAAIAASEEQLRALRVRLSIDHGRLAAARYPHLWSAAELQMKLLGPDEAAVSFYLATERSTAWIVRPAGVQTVSLPGKAAIDGAVKPFLAAVQDPSRDARAAAGVLEEMLAPVFEAIGNATRVVIVPDGSLNYVPFEALADASGKLLVERFAVDYAPSASSYAYLRTLPRPSGDRVVAIGNPMLKAEAGAVERGMSIDRMAWLKPLPNSGVEIRSIAALFPGASRTLEGASATEPALDEADVSRAAILHFATHALIDEEHADRSGLALTAAPPSDGILQTREIYKLRLNAALVTLSACQTALGKNITGEGLMGFSRAFFYAGTNAVMASLWNVNDSSAATFMAGFYRRLAKGEAIDAAARETKLAFLAGDARFRHPYYWAPFIVQGNAAVAVHVAVTPLWRRAGSLAVAGSFLLAAIALIWRSRRGRRTAGIPAVSVHS